EVVKTVDQVVLTRQWVLDELIRNVHLAEERDDLKARNRALELLGKELKMFVDRSERGKPGEFDHMTTEEVRARLGAIRAARRASGEPKLKLVGGEDG